MYSGIRIASIGLWSAMIMGSSQMACTHDKASKTAGTEMGSEEMNEPLAAPPPTTVAADLAEPTHTSEASVPHKTKAKAKKALHKADASVKTGGNEASVATDSEAPPEPSDEEYMADVDSKLGETNSTAINSEADNSRVNRLNDGDVSVSADQQGNSKEDVEITRKIRRIIIKNKDLSVYAHNVKIITREGRVVLKGPVRSENERKIIEDTAVTVAGADHVASGIEIKAK